ncbi:Protection of telomeres protein 1 [Neolecta irregularis DAH-3]|uniref:Protection of telomeres protein 1 n=1 Tax=Neolecta irregularis (strain DAH-3) TaxID=1198029 RepID=A0A1U7LQH6_NEOID|nr:Protection of telomeres protein 1 [Neolecta irregularis DAH-3]|eukprot:OLL24907.1 Protection of telomeres protein 1 [Neolecta irregularis DAH-3]
MAPKALLTSEWEYTQIADLKPITQLFNVVGVIAAHRPVRLSKGTDYNCSMTICDPTRSLLGSGLMCQMFRPNPKDLPDLKEDGDVLFLRSLRIQLHNSDNQGITTWNTEWCTYSRKGSKTVGFVLSKEELSYAKELLNWWKNKGGTIAAAGIPASEIAAKPKSKGFTLVKDIQESRFYDIMGEIVKLFTGNGNPVTIYITDYTSNSLVHNVEWGTQQKWQGPYGKYTLQVSIWDIHAKAAQQTLKEGGFCWIRNMRGKLNQDGQLEGALHGDRTYPDRINVGAIKPHDSRLGPLIDRKRNYQLHFEQEKEEYEREMRKKEEEMISSAIPGEGVANVECGFNEWPLLDIGDILALTPHPRKFRTKAKVIDFMPDHLEDFSVRSCVACSVT